MKVLWPAYADLFRPESDVVKTESLAETISAQTNNRQVTRIGGRQKREESGVLPEKVHDVVFAKRLGKCSNVIGE